ncbi:MAG: hypothetical protein LBU36_02805 [Clostridiales bacterium]|jgi:hypothetical protein|nr:hypothetical protein [Clostridiales bacterium]
MADKIKLVRQKKRGVNPFLAALIVAAFGAAIAGGVRYARSRSGGEGDNFVEARRAMAVKLYDRVKEYKYKTPESAEEAVSVSCDIRRLIYGGMLKNDDLLKPLIEQERRLYSDEFRESLPLGEQLDNLKSGLKKYKEQNTICYSIGIEAVHTNNNTGADGTVKTKSTVISLWQTNNMGKLKWRYTLDENNKITSVVYIQ